MKLSEIQLVPEIQALFQENNEYNAIKADITERGIQDPVKVNKHNQLLAGYTRVKIAQELGLDEVPHVVVDVSGDMNAMMEYAILDNIRRRQLTDLQLVEYGMKLEELYEGRKGIRRDSMSEVDRMTTSEGKTRDLVAVQLSEQTGVKMSGKKYERLKTIAAKAVPEVKEKLNKGEITQAAALELVKLDCDEQRKIISKHRDVKDIRKVIRLQEKQEQRKQLAYNSASLSTPDSVTLYHGKMQEEGKKINDNSVDLILTDPPYGSEYLHLWDELAVFAKRVLNPSGYLITYSGQLHLPVVMWKLEKQLEHYWTISLIHSGNKQLINGRDIFCGWKPILIFVKPPLKLTGIRIDDIINGAGREKSLHDWQQAEEELTTLIETFSKPGDTVVDPFAGAGTTLLVAHGLGRMVIGIDDDEQNINIIKGRMNGRKRRFACAPTV